MKRQINRIKKEKNGCFKYISLISHSFCDAIKKKANEFLQLLKKWNVWEYNARQRLTKRKQSLFFFLFEFDLFFIVIAKFYHLREI